MTNVTPIEPAQGHDLLRKLYEPFPAEDHEVRELRKTKNGKIQWSVYIRREAITKRLDLLLPFEWEFKHNDVRRENEYATVKGSLIIKGLTRDNNGGARPHGDLPMSEDVEKAAVTDCFKRCASSWGIGLYLQNAPDIYTEGYEKGDFDTMRQREREALDRVAKWLAPKDEKPQHRIPQPSNGKHDDTPPILTSADIEAALKGEGTPWHEYRIETNAAGNMQIVLKQPDGMKEAKEAVAAQGFKIINAGNNWFVVTQPQPA